MGKTLRPVPVQGINMKTTLFEKRSEVGGLMAMLEEVRV